MISKKQFEPDAISGWIGIQSANLPIKSRILSISDDETLGETRQLLLESAGYLVVTVGSHLPLGVTFVRAFDAAILCRSLHSDCAVRLSERLHRYHPQIRVLRIRRMIPELNAGYDGVCDTLTGAEHLLQSLGEILRMRPRDRSHALPTA